MTAANEIVLLPGLDGSGELFERILPLLAPRLRASVVCYPADAGMTYADYARFVAGRIGARPVVLLGESFSGPVAVLAAEEPGTNVRAVVLAATFLTSPWPGGLVRFVSRHVPPQTSRRVLNWVLMGTRRDPALSDKIKDLIARLPHAVRAARLEAVSRVDVRRQFREGRYPALVLHGRGDWLVPGSSLAAEIRARAHPCEVHGFNAAHLVLQTAAQEAAPRILAFAEKVMQEGMREARASDRGANKR